MGIDLCSDDVSTIEGARAEAEGSLGEHILCLQNERGDELWAVSDEPGGFMIHVCFVFKWKDKHWAYKWIPEIAGPGATDCPVGILNLVKGTKPHGGCSAEWRKAIGL